EGVDGHGPSVAEPDHAPAHASHGAGSGDRRRLLAHALCRPAPRVGLRARGAGARRTLVEMGYTITDLIEPKGATPGFVSGTKRTPDGHTTKGSVRIACSGAGVELRPIEDSLVSSFEFSRGFDYSFTSLVQRPDVETPRVEAGVQVLVQVVDSYQARLDLGGEAARGGNVLVRLTVRNGTDRAVAVDQARLTLVTAGGTSAPAPGGTAL